MNQTTINTYIVAFLKSLQELQVSDASIQRIKDHLQTYRVKSQDNLILPGNICRDIYLIFQGGFVCRYIHPKTGVAKTINFYLNNLHPFMACVDSFFTQTTTNCELKAIADSVVVAFPKRQVDILREQDEQLAKFYWESVMTAFIEENELKTKLITGSSKEKYDFILQEMPAVIRAVPIQYIAEFCGVTPQWLHTLQEQTPNIS